MKKMGTFLFISFMVLFSAGCGKTPGGAGEAPASAAAASPAGTEFGYPVAGEPWYYIKGRLELAELPADARDGLPPLARRWWPAEPLCDRRARRWPAANR